MLKSACSRKEYQVKRAILICLAVVMFAVTGRVNMLSASEKEVFKNYTCHMNYFTAKIPKSWVRHENITAGEAAKEYGVHLRGPQNKDGGFTSISIIYYGPDHGRFNSAEKFLKLNSDPNESMPLPGETFGLVETVSIAGRSASQFDKKTFIFIPPYAVEPVKIPMFERTIVLKGNEGFYALTYSAPEDISGEYMEIFEQVIASFTPNA